MSKQIIEAKIKMWQVYSTPNGNMYVRVPGRRSAYIGNIQPERTDHRELVSLGEDVECEVLGRVVFDRDV